MPVGDARQAELARLKNKMLEVEGQLKEEKKVTAKLRENAEKKIKQVMAAEEETTAEIERFRWKREENLYARKSMQDDAVAKILKLIERENWLQLQMADFDLVTYENDLRNQQLKEVSNEQLRSAEAQRNERDVRAQKNFDARIEMDNLHRATIKTFDDDYQKEAIAKMKLEASQASTENDRIYTEFDIREARTNELIRQQQESFDKLMQVRIKRDVMAVSVEIQEKNIVKHAAENKQYSSDLMQAAEKVDILRKELAVCEMAVVEKNQLLDEAEELEQQIQEMKENISECTRQVNLLCRKILLESFDIVKKEQQYQNQQISKRMGNMGANLAADTVDNGASDNSADGGVIGKSDDNAAIVTDSPGNIGQEQSSAEDILAYSPDKGFETSNIDPANNMIGAECIVDAHVSIDDVFNDLFSPAGADAGADAGAGVEAKAGSSSSSSSGSSYYNYDHDDDAAQLEQQAMGPGKNISDALKAAVAKVEREIATDVIMKQNSDDGVHGEHGPKTAQFIEFDPNVVWHSAAHRTHSQFDHHGAVAAAIGNTAVQSARIGADATANTTATARAPTKPGATLDDYKVMTANRKMGIENPDVRRKLRSLHRALKSKDAAIDAVAQATALSTSAQPLR